MSILNKYFVVMYDWPKSQVCMGCINGEFIVGGLGNKYNNSNYICEVSCRENDGIYCPLFKEKDYGNNNEL